MSRPMFKPKRVDLGATDTLIGEGTMIEGNIKSETSLRIEGKLLGDLECGGDVTIGEHGYAKSNIVARNVVIAGVVRGNVETREALTLTATGQLYGNASAKALVVAEGAVFQGMSRMEGKAAKAASEPDETDRAAGTGADAEFPQQQSYGSTAV